MNKIEAIEIQKELQHYVPHYVLRYNPQKIINARNRNLMELLYRVKRFGQKKQVASINCDTIQE